MLSLGTFPQDNIPPPIPREAENPHNLEPDLDPVLKVMLGLFIVLWAGSVTPAHPGPAACLSGLASTFSPRILCLSNQDWGGAGRGTRARAWESLESTAEALDSGCPRDCS